MVGEDRHQIAVRIAQKLRDAGSGCTVINTVRTDPIVLRRDRIIISLALTLLTALAWSYSVWLSADVNMGSRDMTGFRMIPSGMGLMMPAHAPWQAMEIGSVFAMWTVMMVGIMTPSAAPMILMYDRLGQQTEARGLAATVWFGVGYFLVWVAFSLLATLVHWAFERSALLDSPMVGSNNVLGALLVAAGSYQWTKLKDICLAQCQTPFAFLIRNGGFRHDAAGCVILGLRHGAYCVGCCWALMMPLLVDGVDGMMNVHWLLLITMLVLLEQVTSSARQIALLAGVVLITGGAWLLLMGTF
jgi:predicted metal-binding membrane protein